MCYGIKMGGFFADRPAKGIFPHQNPKVFLFRKTKIADFINILRERNSTKGVIPSTLEPIMLVQGQRACSRTAAKRQRAYEQDE